MSDNTHTRPTPPRLFLPIPNPPDEDAFRLLAGESRIRQLVDGFFLDRATLMTHGAPECARLLRHADGRARELPVIVDLGGPQTRAQAPALKSAVLRIAVELQPEAIVLGRGFFPTRDMAELRAQLREIHPRGMRLLRALRREESSPDRFCDEFEPAHLLDTDVWPDHLPLPPEGDELERLSQRLRPDDRGNEHVLVLHPAVVAGRDINAIVDTLRSCREQIGPKAV